MEKTKKIHLEDRQSESSNHQPATFVVKVIYSKNSSVQGYLHWLEKEKSIPFRSYMELTHLINEALSTKQVIKFRSWQTDAQHMVNDVKN